MQESKIKKITIVGADTACEVGQNDVEEIKNLTRKNSNSVDWVYHAYNKNGQCIRSIINCPVDIEYFHYEEDFI